MKIRNMNAPADIATEVEVAILRAEHAYVTADLLDRSPLSSPAILFAAFVLAHGNEENDLSGEFRRMMGYVLKINTALYPSNEFLCNGPSEPLAAYSARVK
jgi:hypothetical protein